MIISAFVRTSNLYTCIYVVLICIYILFGLYCVYTPNIADKYKRISVQQ